MKIGFDIDGVLTDFESFIIEKGRDYFKAEPKNLQGDDIAEVFGLPVAQETAFWRDMIVEYATNCPSRPDTATVFEKLKKDGHQIFIITNRCLDLSYCDVSVEKMKQYVKKWLTKEKLSYDEIIFNMESSKLKKCKECGLDVMIEDYDKHVNEISRYMPMVCFDAGYNRSCEGKNIFRCFNMMGLYDLIVKLQEY